MVWGGKSTGDTKECPSCSRILPINAFRKTSMSKKGFWYRSTYCVECENKKNLPTLAAWGRKWRAENSEVVREYRKKNRLKFLCAQYFILDGPKHRPFTEADYWRLMNEQGGKCRICGTDIIGTDSKGKTLACIDHNHVIERLIGKKVARGLLCGPCNKKLGLIEKRGPPMESFLEYLVETSTAPDDVLMGNVGNIVAYAKTLKHLSTSR